MSNDTGARPSNPMVQLLRDWIKACPNPPEWHWTFDLHVRTVNLLGSIPTGNETNAVATDPCRVAAAIGLLERFRDGRISSLNSTHESILGCRAQLESERDVFGYAIDALRTLPARYGPAQKAFVQLCAPHGQDWLTCPECAKAAVNGGGEL